MAYVFENLTRKQLIMSCEDYGINHEGLTRDEIILELIAATENEWSREQDREVVLCTYNWVDYSEMDTAELRDLCVVRKISCPERRKDIIKALRDYDYDYYKAPSSNEVRVIYNPNTDDPFKVWKDGDPIISKQANTVIKFYEEAGKLQLIERMPEPSRVSEDIVWVPRCITIDVENISKKDAIKILTNFAYALNYSCMDSRVSDIVDILEQVNKEVNPEDYI